MKRIGIVAAMPGELKPLVSGWKRLSGNVWTGMVAGHECMAVAGGMGADAARRACERIFSAGRVDVLMSVGWAGALSCGVKPPDAYEVKEVVDALTEERFLCGQESGMRLATLGDRV